MTMNYGSFAYFMYPCLIFAILALLFFAFRKKSERIKKIVVLVIAFLNLFQHFFKFLVYPHLWGTGFTLSNTVYNMCAFLIVATPFALLSKKQSFQDFICGLGVAAGLITLFIPYWYIGKKAYGWDLWRFYICHGLLLYSSLLPLLFKTHRLSYKSWYTFAPFYFLAECIIIVNDIVFLSMGMGLNTGESVFDALYRLNPVWTFHPASQFTWVADLLDPFTPDLFFHDGSYVPILWYFIPLYLFFSLVSFLVFSIADRKNFLPACRQTKARVQSVFQKWRNRRDKTE